jgi:hypothetical protein
MTQAFNLSQLANKVNSSGQLDVSTGLTGSTPVANGGTGQSTYTNGQLLIGNTAGNTLAKATLTAGTGISVTNGGGSITIASTVTSGQYQFNVYTSGTTTWTCPAGVTRVKATLIGGGGASTEDGPSGGSGGYASGVYTVTPSTGYTVTVGAGGASNGASGGTSSFHSFISATGGNGSGGSGSGSGGNIVNGNIIYGRGSLDGTSSGVGGAAVEGSFNVGTAGAVLLEYIG